MLSGGLRSRVEAVQSASRAALHRPLRNYDCNFGVEQTATALRQISRVAAALQVSQGREPLVKWEIVPSRVAASVVS